MKKTVHLILSDLMPCSKQILSGNMEQDHQVDQVKVIPLASLRQCETMLFFFPLFAAPRILEFQWIGMKHKDCFIWSLWEYMKDKLDKPSLFFITSNLNRPCTWVKLRSKQD